MEEGSLRCDANVSVNLEGAGLGTKVEVKNMNSFRFVREAIEFEIARQTEALEEGEKIWQETRLWNENRGITATMRRKESSNDYRFFPEPDLPSFHAGEDYLAAIAGAAIPSPLERKMRLVQVQGIPPERADAIVEERSLAELYDAALAEGADPGATAVFIESDVRARVNRFGLAQVAERLDGRGLAAIVGRLGSGAINAGTARAALDAAVAEGKDPAAFLDEDSQARIGDSDAIAVLARAAVAAEADSVAAYRAGNAKALARVMGAAMRASKGRADPKALEAAIMKEVGA
jgi:aspartyl-tRNA(Asn)/glutamyl-tRNA(Gln) amidotransferase subunit B